MSDIRFIPTDKLKPELLCVGMKRGSTTIIYFNKDRDIPDVVKS